MEKKFSYNKHIITILMDDKLDIEYDIDSVLKIDYTNVFAEIITFPVLLNRFGILLADIDNAIKLKESELEKEKADLKRQRAIAERKAFDALKEEGIKSPTISQIEGVVHQNKEHQVFEDAYRNSHVGLIEMQHDRDIVNSIYWACKTKSNMLEKLTDKLNPLDLEQDLIDFSINNIQVKGSKKLFQTQ